MTSLLADPQERRLTRPLLRNGGGRRELTWPEAVGWAAQRLNEVREAHGPDALGVLTSSRASRESAYLLRKLFRTVIGTRNLEALPSEPSGPTVPDMLRAAEEGRIRGLWIQGESVGEGDPDPRVPSEVLRRLDLLVVQGQFLTEAARHAHLVLPVASAGEQNGSFGDGERGVRRVHAERPPPGDARPDWEVARDVANALGAGWRYGSAGAVLDEMSRLAPRLLEDLGSEAP